MSYPTAAQAAAIVGRSIRPYYATRANANTAASGGSIANTAQELEVGGYAAEGDCPRHRYAWQASVNAQWHARTYFADSSSRGGYWVYAEAEVDPRHFGAVADRFAYYGASVSTTTPNQVSIQNGRFTSADVGKVIGLTKGGPAVAARWRMEWLASPYGGRTITINGQTITFVNAAPVGMQVDTTSTRTFYAMAKSFVDLINANSATFGCTASVPDASLSTVYTQGNLQAITLTANTAGTAGNAITVSSTCEFWQIFRFCDTFYDGLASGPLVTTITSVSGAVGTTQTIGIAAAVSATATGVNVSGGTDNSTAIAAALTLSGIDDGYVTEPNNKVGGVGDYGRRPVVLRQLAAPVQQSNVYSYGQPNIGYCVASPVLLYNNSRLMVDGSTSLAALPGFPSGRAIVETGAVWAGFGSPDGLVPVQSARVEGAGNIIATDWADRGVWLRSSQYAFVGGGLRVTGAKFCGVEFGDPVGRYQSWSNELGSVLIQGASPTTGNTYGNSPDSRGFWLSTSTDAIQSGKCDVVAYRYGIVIDRECTLQQSHCWTYGVMPQKSPYLLRSNCTLIGAESDTAGTLGDATVGECYAFWAINCWPKVYGARNFTAGSTNDEVIFCRNEGGPSGSQQPVVTFYNAHTGGARLLREACSGNTGATAFKTSGKGAGEQNVRYIGALHYDNATYPTPLNSGFATKSNEPQSAPNLIENATFDSWRVATDQALMTAGNIYGPDRWYSTTDATTGTRTMRRVTSTQAGSQANSYSYALEIDQTVAPTNGSYIRIIQRLPRRVLMAMLNKVISFRPYFNTISGSLPSQPSVSLIWNFGTGGAATLTTSIGSVYNTELWYQFIGQSPTPSTVKDDAYLELRIDMPLSGVWKVNFHGFDMAVCHALPGERNFYPPRVSERLQLLSYYEAGSVYAPSTTPFWVPFHAQKQAVPTLAVTGGTASQTTVDGFLLTPTASGAVTFTADASL